MSTTLGRVTDVVLIVAAVTVVAVVVFRFVYLPLAGDSFPRYEIGETFDGADVVDYRLARKTVVLFIDSECQFCTDSMPFYRRLGSEITDRQAVRVVAVSFEDVEISRQYLSTHDVEVDEIARIQPGDLKLQATPTLVVVDQAGVVRGFWLGMLTDERELEVVKLLEL